MFISTVQQCQSSVCTHIPCTHICTQLYVHVSLPPTHPPSLTPRSSRSTEPSSLCYRQHPTSCFIHGSVYTSMLPSHSSYTLLPPVCPQVRSLYLRLYHCHQHRLSRFSLYVYVNIILVFLTYFLWQILGSSTSLIVNFERTTILNGLTVQLGTDWVPALCPGCHVSCITLFFWPHVPCTL